MCRTHTNAIKRKKDNMREENIWLSGLQDRRFLRLENRKSQSMNRLLFMFTHFVWIYLREKRKKRSLLLVSYYYFCLSL